MTGTQLLYSTYIGGNGQDNANAIAVDAAGNAYITGFTGSTNFPAVNAVQPANRGRSNAFVSKLSPTGALLFSTHLGGSTGDLGSSIGVNADAEAIAESGRRLVLKHINLHFRNSSPRRCHAQRLALDYRLTAALTLLAVVVCGQMLRASGDASETGTEPNRSLPSLRGEEAVKHLQEQGLYASLQEAIQAALYAPRWVENTPVKGMRGAYEMNNAANHLRAYVDGSHLRVVGMGEEQQAGWELGMRVTSCGVGVNQTSVAAGEASVRGNRVEMWRGGGLIEWYENSARGLEQGFTIEGRPGGGDEKGALRIGIELSGSLRAQMGERGEQVGLSDGRVVLVYEKLEAFDARGEKLKGWMELEDRRLWLVVEQEGAEYPLEIDPLLREQLRVTASDGAANDEFGQSVAISGDTIVVGADSDDLGANIDQGSAYVFARSGVSWTQQAKLTASDGAANDLFGESVGISGDTIVVGADSDDVGANVDQGSAYVFARSGVSWSQQAKLTASDSDASDFFGESVGISGDMIVVGAVGDDVGANGVQGSAYVFVRSGVSWTHQAKLTASDGAANDFFGRSVGISGDTIVVGAFADDVGANGNQGSAYVFVRSGVSWSQQAQLTASDGAANDQFGISVGISGETIVVGVWLDDVGANNAQGSAYVFVRSGVSWTERQRLTASDGAANDDFGISVGISGDMIVVGSSGDDLGANVDQGSAYVFVRSGSGWTERQRLTASDGDVGDSFGESVEISGDTIVVGAFDDDVGANANQGSAYIYVCNWDQQAKLTASDGAASDQFGSSVGISGDTVVVGAILDDIGANINQGSAYVFVRSGVSWSQQAKLTASDGAANDNFGESMGISGDTIVVGARFDDVGATLDQGSAYVFARSGVSWSQQAQLTASDGAANDDFGRSVGISGDTIVVGANADNVGANSDQGSAYVFVRSGVSWTEQAKLTASDGATIDQFGRSVGISGDTIVVGAYLDDVGANSDQGSAYLFVRSGASWSQQAKLTASDGAAFDQFGFSVAISGDTIVVGANLDDVGANVNQGSAYVFSRSGVIWTEQAKMTASDGAANDQFSSVAISGDTIVVGAPVHDVGANVNQGSSYVFARSGVGWTERQRLTASDGAANDHFGSSVAMSEDTIVVGAAVDTVGANGSQGSAYVFFTGCNTSPSLAAANQVRQKGSPATLSTIATVDDGQDPIGFLAVSVISVPSGILLTGITNSNGVITAQVAALCNAALGNNAVLLRAEDSDGATGQVTLYVNVTANTAPSLGSYADTSVLVTNSVNVTPSAPPFDKGSIVTITADSPTFAGGLSINPDDGVVMIDNARPAGTHVVTVTAIDNCGASRSRAFILTVTCQSITVNPSTIPAGTAGSPYSQTFTQTGGNGAIIFAVSGTLPTGLSFTLGTATLAGTPTQVGSFSISVTATDQNNCAGSRNYTLTINAPMLVWNGSTSSNWHTSTNWTPNAVPATYHDVSIPSTGVTNEPVVGAASSAINAMTLQSGRVLTINSTRELSTAANITSSGTITGGGKLLFDGATFTQNGSVSVASVEFNSGAHALTGGGAFGSGIITVLGGATVNLTSAHSVSVIVINSGGTFDATGRTLTLTGAGTPIFNSGSFVATASTIIYQGTIAQVITANIGYNNLTANNAGGLSLAGDTTVNGLLTLTSDLTTGSYVLTMPNAGTSTGVGDVVGNVKRTAFVTGSAALSFGNVLNTIRINTGTAPSDITVNLVKTAPVGFSNTVTRTYTVTPNGGSGYSATMRLRYKDSEATGLNESTFELWRFTGASWVSPAGSATRDTSQNWVEESGITHFSPWTIAGPTGPTLVELISFEATSYDDGTVLEWQTGLEVDNLGFNVYRERDGKRTLVNSQLIAGSALLVGANTRLGSGHKYAWWDEGKGKEGETGGVGYWLEDVDLSGTSTWHGPFYAERKAGSSGSGAQNAKTLAQLAATESVTLPVEFRASVAVESGSSAAGSRLQLMAESGGGIKLWVNPEAWYRVTGRELIETGLNPDFDPRNLHLFVDGKQQAIRVTGEEDGRLDADDTLEFYGTGLDSPFTDLRIYYLVAGKTAGLRVPRIDSPAEPMRGGSFESTVERRDRMIYFAALRNGDRENFFGSVVAGQPVDQTVTVKHLATTLGTATLTVALQGVTNVGHQVRVMLNGASVGRMVFEGHAWEEASFSTSTSLLREGTNQVTLAGHGGPSDVSLVDHIRITYPRSYTADDDTLKLTARADERLTIEGFSNEEIQVFDVTDPQAVQEIAGHISKGPSGGFSVSLIAPSGRGARSLLAVTRDRAWRVTEMMEDESSSLRDADEGADLVIITRREMKSTLEPLIELRRKQGLSVMRVDVEDIYDEFSYGNKTPYAVREFLAYAQSQWKKKPRYVLIAGDASYDSKNYLGLGAGDQVPTKLVDTAFMETASDEWLADLDGDGVGELAVGRLPVRTAEEASLMVGKIVASEKAVPARELLLVADENDGYDFEAASSELGTLVPAWIRVTRVDRGQLDPETAKKDLLEGIHRGQRIVNYTGHGSVSRWRGNLLTNVDALTLRNGQLPMFVMMSCLNGYFQDAAVDSLAESLLKSELGGAVAVWGSSGMTMPGAQAAMNRELYRLIFTDKSALTMGEAARRAKLAVSDLDVRRTWVFLGDPTTRLR